MKKIIALLLLLIVALPSVAEVIKYKATSVALKMYDYDREDWADWTDWEECDILVVVDADRDLITVYSQETQEYDIVEYLGEEEDADGVLVKFNGVDQNGGKCNVRLRVQNDGQQQLYVDYSDASWVYNIQFR